MNEQIVKIGDRELKLTNLDKVYWPKDGYTKGDLISYYRQIAPVILPYLKDRPENLHRFPHGIIGDSFYQKNMEFEPDWVKTHLYHGSEGDVNYLLCQNEATLVYMANLSCIEVNPWSSRVAHLDEPDWLVLDIDPPKDRKFNFDQVVEVANTARKIFERAQVESYCKTSGGTGLHVFVPLKPGYSYEQAKQFTHVVALLVNAELPGTTSLERIPAKRGGKIYLDYLQNSQGQTLACAYSVRPKPAAPVSTPLKWSEVKTGLDPTNFNLKNTPKRVDKVGDLWQPVLRNGVDLKKALALLSPEYI